MCGAWEHYDCMFKCVAHGIRHKNVPPYDYACGCQVSSAIDNNAPVDNVASMHSAVQSQDLNRNSVAEHNVPVMALT